MNSELQESKEGKSFVSDNSQIDQSKINLDFSNRHVKELVVSTDNKRNEYHQLKFPELLEQGLNLKSFDELKQEKQERRKEYNENTKKLRESGERKWLEKHGKKNLIDFNDKERSKLKQYFLSLDEDGSGTIGVSELEDPLISLGIAESRAEVERIVHDVDNDGQIEFDEFLSIIKSKNTDKNATSSQKNSSAIVDFFKDMIEGNLAGGAIPKNLPFQMIISTLRRQKLMDAIMSDNVEEKLEGERVMKAYAKLLSTKLKSKPDENFEKNSTASVNSKSSNKIKKGSSVLERKTAKK